MPSGRTVHELSADIYNISTPITFPGEEEFTVNQYLIVDDAPLLFHTGLERRLT